MIVLAPSWQKRRKRSVPSDSTTGLSATNVFASEVPGPGTAPSTRRRCFTRWSSSGMSLQRPRRSEDVLWLESSCPGRCRHAGRDRKPVQVGLPLSSNSGIFALPSLMDFAHNGKISEQEFIAATGHYRLGQSCRDDCFTVLTIYGVSRTIVAPSLYIWSVQITQSYGGDCPANTVDCLTLQILLTKTYNRRFLANPTDKYASQWSSKSEARSSTGKNICQLDLWGIADYRSFSIGFATLDNLRCWQDNHLRTIE